MKILIAIGTRPEAIKMAPLIIRLKEILKNNLRVCVTSQHRELQDEILRLFKIKPDYDLNIMKNNQSLFDITINILKKFNQILISFKPQLVLVHGDTSTTMSISLACFYNKIDVGHIESGLRTNNIYDPWPEEVNRKITDLISVLHFPPTNIAKQNLKKENIKSRSLVITGNTVVDSLLIMKDKLLKNDQNRKKYFMKFKFIKSKFILVTCHRRENFGMGVNELCKAIKIICRNDKNIKFVLPLHPNPNIKNIIQKKLKDVDGVHLISPLGYASMVYVMMNSYLIFTDSGGIQEEAPSLNKPILIYRDKTERPEIIDKGGAILVKKNTGDIIKKINKLFYSEKIYKKMSMVNNPYGDGKATFKIIESIKKLYKQEFNS